MCGAALFSLAVVFSGGRKAAAASGDWDCKDVDVSIDIDGGGVGAEIEIRLGVDGTLWEWRPPSKRTGRMSFQFLTRVGSSTQSGSRKINQGNVSIVVRCLPAE